MSHQPQRTRCRRAGPVVATAAVPILTAVLVGTAGCGDLAPGEPGPASSSPTQVASAPAPSSTASPSAVLTSASGGGSVDPTASPSTDGSGDLGTVVAARSAGVDTMDSDTMKSYGDPATLQLYPLRRTGRVLQLNFAITLDRRAHAPWLMVNELGKPDSLDDSIGGVQLLDVDNAKVYYAGRDRDNDCLCSGTAELGPGQSVVFTAAFAAPPPDVRSMTVSIPLFGSFSRVPIV